MSNKSELQIDDKVVFTDCEYNRGQNIVGCEGVVEDFPQATDLVISIQLAEGKRYYNILTPIEVDLIVE